MKKRFFASNAGHSGIALFACMFLGFVLFSCSDSVENASLSFRISSDFARVLKNQTDSEGNAVSKYLLKIKVQGEYSSSQDFSLSVLPDKDEASVYEIEDLPAGKNIQVLAFLYSLDKDGNEFLVYMTEDSYSLSLQEGNNEIPLSLNRVKFIINAEGEGGEVYISDTGFSDSGNVPYLSYDETLSFSLKDYSDASDFEWRMNGNPVGNEKTLSLVLSQNEYVNIDRDSGGENSLSCVLLSGEEKLVALFRFRTLTGTSAVWEDKIKGSTVPTLRQLSSYNSGDESSELKIDASGIDSKIYTFDSGFNLWAVESYDSNENKVTISKRKMDISEGLYQEEAAETCTFSSGMPIDMYYDTESAYLYILSSGIDSSNYMTLQAFSALEKKVVAENGNIISCSNIAVHGGMIYISDSACAVYKADFKIEGENIVFTSSDVQGSPFVKVADLVPSEIPDNAGYDLTDIQIGDGKGNDTDSLYALYREYTDEIALAEAEAGVEQTLKNVYARGSLVKIFYNESNSDWMKGFYGVGEEKTETIEFKDTDSYKQKASFYTSSDLDERNLGLLGPAKFVALVPKKLVFLDDGIEYTGKGTFKNKDSLFEFDIATETLSRGSSVQASKPAVGEGLSTLSGFSVED